jgi:hypothetical protein
LVYEAIRDEKNPVVLSYLENLRHQVAAIVAKYDARVVDILTRDVMDRMSVDDLDAASKLVERIGLFQKESVPRKESTELRGEVRRMEDRAREVIGEAIGFASATPEFRNLVVDFLDAGMIPEATKLAACGFPQEYLSGARIRLAKARSFDPKNPAMAIALATEAMMLLDMKGHPENRACLRTYADAYALRLRLISRDELYGEARRLLASPPTNNLPIEDIVLAYEQRRRRMATGNSEIELQQASQVAFDSVADGSWQRDAHLLFAEIAIENGLSPKHRLTKAMWSLRLERGAANVATAKTGVGDILEAVGKAGAFRLVDDIMSDPRLTAGWNVVDLWYRLARGCAEAGNVAKAIEILRTKPLDDLNRNISRKGQLYAHIAIQLLRENKIAQADQFLKDSPELDRQTGTILANEYFYAFARRGDDILAKDLDVPTSGTNAVVRAKIVIATIAFTTAMKKRLNV